MSADESETNDALAKKANVGHSLVSLAYGYQTHQSAVEVALNPEVLKFVKDHRGLINDVGKIPRLNDRGWEYSKLSWLEHPDYRSTIDDLFSMTWLSGALINAGDLLSRHKYFDRHPMLEMIRHLRNAVAHGNTFRIDSVEKLKAFPANNREAKFQGWDGPRYFEVSPDLQGKKFMFEYMAPANVLDILLSCGFLLIDQANSK